MPRNLSVDSILYKRPYEYNTLLDLEIMDLKYEGKYNT